MTKEQAEEVRKKRLERFGPVDTASRGASADKDGEKIDDKSKGDGQKSA